MSRLNVLAVILALPLTALAVGDALAFGLTGRNLVSDDGTGLLNGTPVHFLSGFIHGFSYLAIVAVLVFGAGQVFTGRPVRQVLRWLLVAVHAVLGIAFVASGAIGTVPIDMTVPFLLSMILAMVLGIVLLAQRDRSPSAWILGIGMPLAVVVIVVLGVTGSRFAHPAYAEVATLFGLALLGWRYAAAPRRTAPTDVTAPRVTV
ncbi:hypothetical protein [Granulicoccus phenolivorans]|uniref:hypothetical protein n=1 Tax=Granulicoccus phenolivorans TaxID=266854 RepID=UPI0003F85311|nr:hypothetical protein [Granulicoccus phenolivorans]